MIQIVLSTKKEADFIWKLLLEVQNDEDDTVMFDQETMITCQSHHWQEFIQQTLIPTFIKYFVQIKEPKLLLSIIKEKYYFTDEDEQQQILHIAQSIMDGEYEDIPKAQKFESRDRYLYAAFQSFLHPDLSFHMDSFIMFRLHTYLKKLTEYVELSIEEYKLEQEYQNFIQTLRDYVIRKEPKIENLHILHEHSSFIVYNDTWEKLSRQELKQYIDRHFIFQHPMYIDSQILAPLVSIAPLKIYIYSDRQDEGMILTIQNIFQERVVLFNKNVFYKRKVSF
ncbi:putative sporulation protein YtxC [Bacillus alveayuensis]|uniref:Sporulation protein YtxC n=1 Tax=Aeribacillus alveayuensis TaxID=279215 RepID=A0ABT9VJG6_9BACI|nr:putative sporulation protein YtxC [Bacillus alveayuensis]MDQ0161107.1 putative sporulation protein YtxC [Bacillus alveayuensis]